MRKKYGGTETLTAFIGDRAHQLGRLLGIEPSNVWGSLQKLTCDISIDNQTRNMLRQVIEKMPQDSSEVTVAEKFDHDLIIHILQQIKPAFTKRLLEWHSYVNAFSPSLMIFMKEKLQIEEEDIVIIVKALEDRTFHENNMDKITSITTRYLDILEKQKHTTLGSSLIHFFDELKSKQEYTPEIVSIIQNIFDKLKAHEVESKLQDFDHQTL